MLNKIYLEILRTIFKHKRIQKKKLLVLFSEEYPELITDLPRTTQQRENYFGKFVRSMLINGEIVEVGNSYELTQKGKKILKGGKDGSIFQLENPYKIENLIFPTSHLSFFDNLYMLSLLCGKEYVPILKTIWYSLHGLVIRLTIQLGRVIVDTRVNLAVPVPSGLGKKNLEQLIKDLVESLGFSYTSPTSFHPEQFVGKTRIIEKRKETTYQQNPGHLDDDYIVINEAVELLTSQDESYKETRKYIRCALDPIGRNEIMKRRVDCPREHTLMYVPKCTIAMFFQPQPVPEDVVTTGLLRRFLVIYLKLVGKDRTKEYEERLNDLDTDVLKEKKNEIISHFRKVEETKENGELKFAEEAIQRLKELHQELISQGIFNTKKGRNFTEMFGFSLQNLLVEMSVIQALSHYRTTVEKKDVEYAYIDLCEFFACMLEYINKKVQGNLDYGEAWKGATEKQKECLQFLYQNNATSLETSSITIKIYIDFIRKVFGVGKEEARKIYQKHKKYQWIKSKQVGRHDSRIWLAFSPEVEIPSKMVYPKLEYFKILKKNKISRKTLPPLPPSLSKESDISEIPEKKESYDFDEELKKVAKLRGSD